MDLAPLDAATGQNLHAPILQILNNVGLLRHGILRDVGEHAEADALLNLPPVHVPPDADKLLGGTVGATDLQIVSRAGHFAANLIPIGL